MNVPRREFLGWLAVAFGMSAGDLADLIGRGGQGAQALEPISSATIDAIRRQTFELVDLEVRNGGTSVLPLASRYVAELRHLLAVSSVPPALDSEVWSAAAQMVSTAAWMAHDGDDPDAANRLSLEALYLARLAGDRAAEIRSLSNLGLFKLYYGRPQEALSIARHMLGTDELTPYQAIIFQTREARALATLGAETEAVQVIEEAIRSFSNGPAPKSDEWWWLNPQEMRGHQALTLEAAGQYDRALPIWQELADAPLPTWQGTAWAGQQYLRYQRLFGAAIEVGDWRTAEEAIERLLPYVGIVHCGRVDRWLLESLRRLKRMDKAPPSLRMGGQGLSERLRV